MNPPSKTHAAGVSAALSVLFLVVYGSCNWITAHRGDVGTWYYAWERFIPFVPLMIVPYMSIDLFYVAGPFLCRSPLELRIFARRITLAVLVAGACFLLLPLHLAMPRPQPAGWTGAIFNFLHGFDQPYNLFPSLHITLRTILADLYARHTKGLIRIASHVWFSLIGFSTLLTYQHHIVDIIGGFVLAAVCFYVYREGQQHPFFIPNRRVGSYYMLGSLTGATLAAVGWPWTAILLWPALSLAMVAAAYFRLGPGVYRKSNGRVPLSARVLLAPCLLGQHLSLLYYRLRCRAWDAVTPNIWIGIKLSDRQAQELKRRGITAVVDLTAEFSEASAFLNLAYCNICVLDLASLNTDQLREGVDFIKQHAGAGRVYVHCKVGYSRTAAVVGAYLLASGQVATAGQAIAQLRRARSSIIIRPEARAALNSFESTLVDSRRVVR